MVGRLSTRYPAVGGSRMRPDVIIVGAGLAGLGLAWHLGSSLRVVVVDQGAEPGTGSSGDGVGMVRRLAEDPVERALAYRTADWLRTVGGPDWPDPPAAVTGAVVAAVRDPTWLADPVAQLRARGVAVESLDRPERAAPIAAGARLARAWWVPDELLVDPRRLLQGFARGAARMGVELRCGARVERVIVEAGRAIGVETDRGRIEGGAVVLAAGGWCAGLARAVGLHRPLFPLRRSVLRVPDEVPAGAPWLWIDDVGLYVRPAAGEWWASGCDEAVSFPEGTIARGAPAPGAAERLRDKVRRLLPALADRAVADGWSGLRTFAPDRRPVLGADPELPGLWWLAGLGGSGVTTGAAAAEVVARWMRGEPVPWLPAALVSPGRAYPRRWPLRPDGDVGGAVLVSGALDPAPGGV